MSQMPYSHTIPVADVPPAGLNLVLSPDAPTREALARASGVLAIPALTARLTVAQEGAAGLHVTGTVDGTVRQTCGVTLEPFDAPLSEPVDVHFVPAGTFKPPADAESDENGIDPPDEIIGDSVDLGALVTEFLNLGIDPYPRKPDAVFEQPEGGEGSLSPFSALARLRRDE